MNRRLIALQVCLFSALALSALSCQRKAEEAPQFQTPYQAVLLDNGLVYYGKLQGAGTQFPVLTDVFYIQSQQDAQTKAVKNVLIRRGNELHQPDRMYVNSRHIVFIEPVGPNSQVAQLIAQAKK